MNISVIMCNLTVSKKLNVQSTTGALFTSMD